MKRLLNPACLLLALAVLLAACAPSAAPESPAQPALVIQSSSTSLGGEGGTHETGILSYTFMLTNRDARELKVISFQPELNPAYTARLLSPLQEVSVLKMIAAGETIELGGQLRFDFTGLTKQDIEALGQPIQGWSVQTETYIPRPGLQP